MNYAANVTLILYTVTGAWNAKTKKKNAYAAIRQIIFGYPYGMKLYAVSVGRMVFFPDMHVENRVGCAYKCFLVLFECMLCNTTQTSAPNE